MECSVGCAHAKQREQHSSKLMCVVKWWRKCEEHNHLPDSQQLLTRQQVSNAYNHKTVVDPFERPGKVICREITRDAFQVGMVLNIKVSSHDL